MKKFALLILGLTLFCLGITGAMRQDNNEQALRQQLESEVSPEQVKQEVRDKIFNLREILIDIGSIGKITDSDRLSLYNRSLSQLLDGRTLLTYEAENGRPDELSTVIKSLILSSNSTTEAVSFLMNGDSTGKTAFDRVGLCKDFFFRCGNVRVLIGALLMLRVGEYCADGIREEICSPCPVFSKLSRWWYESEDALREIKCSLQDKNSQADSSKLIRLDYTIKNITSSSLSQYIYHSTINEKMSSDYDDITTFLVRACELMNEDILFLQKPPSPLIFRMPLGRLF